MNYQYRVSGVVCEEESGRPLEGLLVRGFDKDLIFDDHLGDTTTDGEGHFMLEFTDERFRHIFDEDPDLYLRIYDGRGEREIHSTKRAVRRSAGPVEHYEIFIPRERLES